MAPRLRWVTAFLDIPRDQCAQVAAFWAEVTGTSAGRWRGEHDEFATLDPGQGDAHLGVQLVDDAGGVHLDLHTDDVPGLVERAQRLGATTVADHGGWVVLRSPGGLALCVVPGRDERAGRSPVDQVAIDIPPARYGAEAAFWSALVGQTPQGSPDRPEFAVLRLPDGLPLRRLLLQRLAGGDGPVAAHLDLAAGPTARDRREQVERHERLGARIGHEGTHWTTMVAPTGHRYCLTDRDPATGRLRLPAP